MKKITIVAALIIFAISASAQKLKLSDLSIYAGGAGSSGSTISDNDHLRFLSRFNIPSDYTNVNWNAARKSYRYKSELGLMATWDIRKNRKRTPWTKQLRVGFSYGDYSTDQIGYYNNTESYRVDTLVSQQHGNQYYVDSIVGKYAQYENVADMFTIHLNYLMRYNQHRKFSFYTGIGASLGFTLDNSLLLNYGTYSFVSRPIASNNFFSTQDYESENSYQSAELATATDINFYIPIGINYRISKRSKWLRPLNVFTEWRPGLSIHTSEVIGTNATMNSSLNFGLRYSFRK